MGKPEAKGEYINKSIYNLLLILAEEVKKHNLRLSAKELHDLFKQVFAKEETRKDKIKILVERGFLTKESYGVTAKFKINVQKLQQHGFLPRVVDREAFIKKLAGEQGIAVKHKKNSQYLDKETDIKYQYGKTDITVSDEQKYISMDKQISTETGNEKLEKTEEKINLSNSEFYNNRVCHTDIINITKVFYSFSDVAEFFKCLTVKTYIKVLYLIVKKQFTYLYELNSEFGIDQKNALSILNKLRQLNVLHKEKVIVHGREVVFYKLNLELDNFFREFIERIALEQLTDFELNQIENYKRKPIVIQSKEQLLKRSFEILWKQEKRRGEIPLQYLREHAKRCKVTVEELLEKFEAWKIERGGIDNRSNSL